MIALAISFAITSFFYIRVQKQTAASRPKTRRVVVASTDLQPGTKLSSSNLATIDWPEAVPLKGAFEKPEDLNDKIVFMSVGMNEPVLERELASSSSSMGLAGKIPDGMRATAVRTNEVSNLAGFLFPGSRVDVLVTFRGENNRQTTRTVLQNVQVLSTGQNIQANPEGKPENVNVVTLLLTPEDSQKLVLAQAEGAVQFVLRNGSDSASAKVPPVQLAELTGEVARPTPANPQPTRRVERRKPEVFTVETVAGNKSSVTTFPENK